MTECVVCQYGKQIYDGLCKECLKHYDKKTGKWI